MQGYNAGSGRHIVLDPSLQSIDIAIRILIQLHRFISSNIR